MERTNALIRELQETGDLAAWLRRNEPRFLHRTVAQGLTELIRAREISKAELSRRSDVSLVYLHQVFAGRRTPSRDRLLGLCLGLQANLPETQHLLQLAVYAPLCPCNRRDAVVIYGIFHRQTLTELRATMEQCGEAPIY